MVDVDMTLQERSRLCQIGQPRRNQAIVHSRKPRECALLTVARLLIASYYLVTSLIETMEFVI